MAVFIDAEAGMLRLSALAFALAVVFAILVGMEDVQTARASATGSPFSGSITALQFLDFLVQWTSGS